MALPIIGAVLGIGEKLIERLIPDPKQKAEALLELAKLEQSGDLAVIANQVEINKIEAASPNLFISGWRPFTGWVTASGIAIIYVVGPLLAFFTDLFGEPVRLPALDSGTLMALLTGLLGLGGLRTYEKLKGVEGNR